MRRTSHVVIVALLFLQATVVGLIAPPWTFDELRSKSDLIVIAERITTRDAGIKTEFTELRPPFPVVELNTDFKVLSSLKGTSLRAMIVLRHYRQDTERLPGPILNAPLGLDFSRDDGVPLVLEARIGRRVCANFEPRISRIFDPRAARRPAHNVSAINASVAARDDPSLLLGKPVMVRATAKPPKRARQ